MKGTVTVVSDPWKHCKLIFDENGGHFIEMAKDRSYSGPSFRDFLIKADEKESESKKSENGQDWKISFGKWVIKCKLRNCNIVMGTIYKS